MVVPVLLRDGTSFAVDEALLPVQGSGEERGSTSTLPASTRTHYATAPGCLSVACCCRCRCRCRLYGAFADILRLAPCLDQQTRPGSSADLSRAALQLQRRRLLLAVALPTTGTSSLLLVYFDPLTRLALSFPAVSVHALHRSSPTPHGSGITFRLTAHAPSLRRAMRRDYRDVVLLALAGIQAPPLAPVDVISASGACARALMRQQLRSVCHASNRRLDGLMGESGSRSRELRPRHLPSVGTSSPEQ